MKNKEIPSGYIEELIAHTNPVQSVPPPPIIERKEAETLMSHCLKQFVRERLYGNLINYSRQNNTKHSVGQSSLLPKIKTTKAYNCGSALDIREIIGKQKSTVQRYSSKNRNNQNIKQAQVSRYKRRSISCLDNSIM